MGCPACAAELTEFAALPGLLNRVRPNAIRFMPPLIITTADVDEAMAKLQRGLEHFASRGAMNVDGLGESLIAQLIDQRLAIHALRPYQRGVGARRSPKVEPQTAVYEALAVHQIWKRIGGGEHAVEMAARCELVHDQPALSL